MLCVKNNGRGDKIMDEYLTKVLELKEQELEWAKKANSSTWKLVLVLFIILLLTSFSLSWRIQQLDNKVKTLEDTVSEQYHYINQVERNLSSVEEELHEVEHVLDEVDYDEDLEIHNIWCYLIPEECDKPLQRHEL